MKKTWIIILSALAYIFTITGISAALSRNSDSPKKQSDFETAVSLIKKYETLHQPRHWPVVGYGHIILPGEKFSKKKAMSEPDADALLRKDLLKNCRVFREFGKDSLILGVLAYNVGMGTVKRSSLIDLLKKGKRDINDVYTSFCRYKGKVHKKIRQRRIEELEKLYRK